MLTNNELKELLILREPVKHFSVNLHEYIEYAYISGIIIRYNPETKRQEVWAELKDKCRHAVTLSQPKYLSRI